MGCQGVALKLLPKIMSAMTFSFLLYTSVLDRVSISIGLSSELSLENPLRRTRLCNMPGFMDLEHRANMTFPPWPTDLWTFRRGCRSEPQPDRKRNPNRWPPRALSRVRFIRSFFYCKGPFSFWLSFCLPFFQASFYFPCLFSFLGQFASIFEASFSPCLLLFPISFPRGHIVISCYLLRIQSNTNV